MGKGLELFALHAEGFEIPVDISLAPFEAAGRRLTACMIRDLRGHVHGSETLRLHRKALLSAANGVVITDRDGIITWVNPAASRITGYLRSELIGRHTRLLKSGSHDDAFYRALWQTVSRGETWFGTIVNRRKDGSTYDEEQTITPVIGPHSEVTHFIAIKQDVTVRRRAEAALAEAHTELAAKVAEIESLNRQLRDESLHDPLTGLHNRRYLDRTMGGEVARAHRSGAPLAVAMIDLDRFKEVNDQHGHGAGDTVLRAIAVIVQERLRTSDLLCRVGGDEILAVLPEACEESALERFEGLCRAIADSRIQMADGSELRCTVSIGLAFLGSDEDSLDATLQRADAALYRAKEAGRNRVVSTCRR